MTATGERGVALPGEPEFADATRVFNLAAPARPAAAVTARTVEQVRAALRHAAAAGRRVRVHTTGHASAARRPVGGDALLIRTRLDGEVRIDPRRRIARIPAGTCWDEVVAAAAPHGLAAPHGSAKTVGVVGYLLGGGLSFYGREIGLAVGAVRAVELVTADGEPRRADADSDPELFWALRGGGGGFGVVTAVEIALFPAAGVITGAAYWPGAHAGRLLSAWRRWTLDAPPEATTSARVMNLPPVPGVPPELSAGVTLCVDGAVLCADGDEVAARRRAADLLEPLRAIADPVLDTWAPTSLPGVLEAHLDPPEPVPFVGDHMLLDDPGDDGLAEFLRVTGEGSGSPFVGATIRQLGGAFATPDPDGGALDHLDPPYAYMGSGAPFDPITPEALRAHCATVREALRPWDTGRTVPCFVESFEQPQGHLSAARRAAVDRVRRRVDPEGMFRDDVAPGASEAR